MATDGGNGEEDSRSPGGDTEEKKEFDVDTLSKPELRFLLSIMEGELEARDLVIEALRARRKEVFIQERYGRFNLSDPFLALQRDYDVAAAGREKKAVCSNPLTILEAVMAHCRKMQERMTAQLAAAESRQRKLELEKCELQNLEQEHKKLSVRLEEERAKNKHIVLTLVKECKQLSSKMIEESQKLEEMMSKFEAEKKKTSELEEALAAEKQRSTQMEAQMEAQMEKQLSEFDTEREQLRAKLSREEAHTNDLKQEIDKMMKTIEQIKKENDRKPNASLPHRSKDNHFVSVGVGPDEPTWCSIACQTDIMIMDHVSESVKKLPLTVLVKPSMGSSLIAGNTKMSIGSNSAFVKPATERQVTYNDLLITPPLTHIITSTQTRVEENGPSTGSTPDLTSNTSLCPNNTISASPASPSYLSSSMHNVHSQCTNTTLHPGLSPRVQAARFRFQVNANDSDQNGNTTQSPPAREISSTSRDNLVAKQLARNTVTQVLSRFTSPQGGTNLRQGMPHSMEVGTYPPLVGRIGHPSIGLKPPTVSKIDRGNPPPIPPKKPGLSQTPSPPHPQLKAIIDGSRPPSIGVKIENKTMSSPPSSSSQGIRVIHEEVLSKSSSPQLPPKPSIDIPVASAGCVIPAVATSQVGAWPPQSPGLRQHACSKNFPVVSTAIVCTSSINPISASSCRPCGSDSLLVTASGWSSSLTPMLMSGGPVPLGGRPTLLHQAAAQGNVTLLSMLLNEEGMDIDFSCEDGYFALYSAAENGHTDCMRLLLTSGAQVDAADKNGFTALCLAAAQGHVKCTELLLAYNADVNHAAEGGQTPLYLACRNGNNECTKLLLEAGADRCTVTIDGWTPVHAAVDSGNSDCLKLLMCYGPPENGNFLSDAGLDPGFFDLDCRGATDSRKVKPVVSADLINHADEEGWTAAHIAASKGFKDCLDILCDHSGLDTEQKDKCNRTVHDVATDDCKHLLENLNAVKVVLRISVDETVCCGTDDAESTHTVGALNIRKQMTWDDFSKTVSQALMDHFQFVVSDGWGSPDGLTFNNTAASSIGLSASSILSIKLGNISWSAGQVHPVSPWDSLKDSKADEVTVSLLGPQEGFLHSVMYASMIPLPALQNFLRLVEQYRNVIFHGPEGSLQDYMAHQIALCMKHKQEALGFHCEIIRADIDTDFSKEQLVELFIESECLIPMMKQPPVTKKTIVILENLEKTSLSGLLEDFLSPLEDRGSANPCTFQRGTGPSDSYYFHENCFLMGTIAKSHLQGSDLLVQQHFRWVQLRWDGEPIHGLLQRFLRRKVITTFKGKLPPPGDPVCKSIDWICAVWHQLNSCLSRLGTPEALIGPKHFLSCPVVPGPANAILKWLSKLWNTVIAPKVQAAVLSRASARRPTGLGQVATRNAPSQGQQAVVKAALSILLNKAVLHGSPLARSELDEYRAGFKGGNFPLSLVSSYSCGKKKGESGSWRKVSTNPRKKSSHLSPASWNKPEENDANSQNGLQQNYNKVNNQSKRKLIENEQPRLSLGSDDDDLVRELQSMCSSKSEPDISKIADSEDDLMMFSNSRNEPKLSTTVINQKKQVTPKDGVCSHNSSQAMERSISKSKMDLGISRAKSQLPLPKSKVSQSSVVMKRSSSNTRQIETSNSRDRN